MRAFKPGSARFVLAVAAAGLLVTMGTTAAAFRSPADNTTNSVTTAPDFRAPTVVGSVLGKTQGGASGFVRKGGTYFVYANVSDSGNPASGTASVSADVSTLTPGAKTVPLSPGSFSAGGQSFNYRSAQQTAAAGLSEGEIAYSLATTDNAANSGSTAWTTTIDNTAPFGADVQTANSSGGTTGRAELGDAVAFTFSEPVEPESILAGWSGSPTSVVVRITTGIALLGGLLGQSEGLQIFDSANSKLLPLGAMDLKQQYVAKTALLLSGSMAFGATGTPSTMTISGATVKVVLGSRSGNEALTVTTPAAMEWAPSSAPYDRAANPTTSASASASESGGADVEF